MEPQFNDELIREHHRIHARTDKGKNWTPGPWEVKTVKPSNLTGVTREGYGYVCDVSVDGEPIDAEAMANARLIAAAPEMYDALEAMLETALGDSQRQAASKAFAAVQKARGEN